MENISPELSRIHAHLWRDISRFSDVKEFEGFVKEPIRKNSSE